MLRNETLHTCMLKPAAGRHRAENPIRLHGHGSMRGRRRWRHALPLPSATPRTLVASVSTVPTWRRRCSGCGGTHISGPLLSRHNNFQRFGKEVCAWGRERCGSGDRIELRDVHSPLECGCGRLRACRGRRHLERARAGCLKAVRCH